MLLRIMSELLILEFTPFLQPAEENWFPKAQGFMEVKLLSKQGG